MSTVENRVVRMTFDNSQFEKNVKTTMDTLSNFEKKLKFDGASAGFDKIKNAADNLNLSGLSQNVSKETNKIQNLSGEASKSIDRISKSANESDMSGLSKAANVAINGVNNAALGTDLSPIIQSTNEASAGFDAFGTVATGVLLGIGNSISDLITGGLSGLARTISDYTIKPITEGFSEYETQIGSIQTILANTGMDFDSDADIQKVNNALDELNKYADETIYKFTDMTQAIGTFTSAGLQLEDAVDAVKGVANVAAFSGASASDVHRVLPQISQALSAGTVTMQDWRSVETANMSSRGFVEAIGDMAVHMATVNKASASAAEAGQALIDKQVTMRQALNKLDNKQWSDWFNSDILSETLKVFTFDLRSATAEEKKAMEEHLASLGYQADEFQKIFDRAQMATRSATEVRTWTQLWDTVGEAIGSNWSGIWRNLIGDFKQSTDTFTFLSNKISSGVDVLLGGLVNASRKFNESGAIDLIFGGFARDADGNKIINELTQDFARIEGALDYLVEAISKPLGAIKDAFDSVFFIDDDDLGVMVVGLAMSFREFASSLVISDDAATAIREIFEGLFSVLKIGLTVVTDLIGVFFNLVDVVRTFLDPAIDIALTLFGQVSRVITWLVDRVLEIRNAIEYVISPIGEVIDLIQSIISELFGFAAIPDKINGVGDVLLGILDILWNFIDIPGKIRLIGDALRGIFGFIGELTGWNAAVRESEEALNNTGISMSVLDIWFDKIMQNPIIAFFKGIADAITGVFSLIHDYISEWDVVELGAEEGTEKVNGLSGAFGVLSNVLSTGLSILKGIAQVLITIISVTFNLVAAIGSFIGRIGEAFVAWEPIKEIVDKLNEFKDGAINFFFGLPEKLAGVTSGSEGPLNNLSGMFETVLTRISGITEYFSKVTFEEFINDIRVNIDNFIGTIKNGFEYFATTSPEQILYDFGLSIKAAIFNIGQNLKEATHILDGVFPELGAGIRDSITNISTNIMGFINGFVGFFTPILRNSTDVPSFFVNLFVAIKDGVLNKLNEIHNTIANFDIVSAINQVFQNAMIWTTTSLYNTLNGIATSIENVFPSLSGVLTGGVSNIVDFLYNTIGNIRGFIVPILKESDSIPEFIFNLFGAIGTNIRQGFSELPGMIFSGLSGITSVLTSGLSLLTDKLSGASGFIGDFFKNIHDMIHNSEEVTDAASNNIPSTMNDMADKVKEPAKSLTDTLKTLWDEYVKSVVPEPILEWVNKVKTYFNETFGGLSGFISTLGDKLRNVFENFNLDYILSIIERVVNVGLMLSLNKAIKSFGFLAGSIAKNLNTVSGAFAKYLKDKNKVPITEVLKQITLMVAVATLSILAISAIPDPWSAFGVLAAVEALLLGVAALTGILTKHFGPELANNLVKTASTIGVLSGSLLLMMYTVTKLTAFDWAGNIKGILIMAGALVALSLVAIAITKLGGNGGANMVQTALGVGILLGAICLLIPKLQELSDFTNSFDESKTLSLLGVLAGIAAFAILLGKALGSVGDHPIGAAIGFILLSTSIGMIADSVERLSKLDMPGMIVAFLGLAALIFEFGKMSKDLKASDLILTAGALMIYSIALGSISSAIMTLTNASPDSVGSAFVTIAGLLFGLYEICKNLKAGDLLATSGAIIIFGGAVGVLTLALSYLATVDPVMLGESTLALAGLLGMFLAIAKLTGGMDLAATSMSIIGFGAAVIELSMSLGFLSQLNSDALWAATGALAGLLGMFAVVAIFTNGVDLLATGTAMLMFGATLMEIAGAILIFDEAIKNFPSFDQMKEVGRAITGGLISGMIEGIADIFDSIVYVVTHIVDVFKSLFGIHSPSTLMSDEIGQFIPAGIGEGILGGEGSITDALGGIFESIKTKIQEFISGFPEWWSTTAWPFITGLWNDFITWFTTDGIPMLQQTATNIGNWIVNDALPFIGEKWGQFCDWFMTDGLPMLQQFFGGILSQLGIWAGEFWNWFTTDGLPMLQNFFGSVLENLGVWGGQLWDWIQTDGLPMLGEAAGKFWEWVTTEGLPKLGEFLKGVLEKLPEWGGQIWHWLTTDGVKILGDLIKGLGDWFANDFLPMLKTKAEEIGGKIKDWVMSLPGKFKDAVLGIGEKLANIGIDIIKGITDGLSKGWDDFKRGAGEFCDNVVQSFKDFFHINSPSKVMKEAVGRFLPEGLAEGIKQYAPAAIEAVDNLSGGLVTKAKDAMSNLGGTLSDSLTSGITDGMDVSGLTNNLNLGGFGDLGNYASPSISPVLDMSSFNDGLGSQSDYITGIIGDGNLNVVNSITGKLDWNNNKFNEGIELVEDDVIELGDEVIELGSESQRLRDETIRLNNELIKQSSETVAKLNSGNATAQTSQKYQQTIVELLGRHSNATINGFEEVDRELENIDTKMDNYLSDIKDYIHSVGAGLEVMYTDHIPELVNQAIGIHDWLNEGNLNVYMDTGELVGAIAPEMDEQLGMRQVGSQRGVSM